MNESPPYCQTQILSVSELNRLARGLLESRLPLMWVAGEISGLTRAASGHLYFTLKDNAAQVRCAIWRNKAQLLGFRPENGQKVEARALTTLYEPKGDYQLNVENLRLAGQGALFERFLELKAKLEKEGLFGQALKRPLPVFPRRLAIVTSPKAAALSDVLTTLSRRAPHIRLTLFPTPVQGEGAGEKIAKAILEAGNSGAEAVLLCRGGGSMEDLLAFNEESVARAIRNTAVPVVSGIGHETDFTIADFVADLRAPTPTSAAEQICPDRQTFFSRLSHLKKRLDYCQDSMFCQLQQRLDHAAARLPCPGERIPAYQDALAKLASRLKKAGRDTLETRKTKWRYLSQRMKGRRPDPFAYQKNLHAVFWHLYKAWEFQQKNGQNALERLSQALRQLNPHAVLERGYAIVFSATGQIVRDEREIKSGDDLHIQFAQGKAQVRVKQPATTETAAYSNFFRGLTRTEE